MKLGEEKVGRIESREKSRREKFCLDWGEKK